VRCWCVVGAVLVRGAGAGVALPGVWFGGSVVPGVLVRCSCWVASHYTKSYSNYSSQPSYSPTDSNSNQR
jgi:hypothetical protein